MEKLYLIATSGEIGERIQALGQFANEEEFHRNFLVDHLDAVLQQYGLSQGQNLQLGVIENGEWTLVFSGDSNPDVLTIWTHHNGAGIVMEGVSVIGHYSGLRKHGSTM